MTCNLSINFETSHAAMRMNHAGDVEVNNQQAHSAKSVMLRFTVDDITVPELKSVFSRHLNKILKETLERARGNPSEEIISVTEIAITSAQLTCQELGGMFVPLVSDGMINVKLCIDSRYMTPSTDPAIE